MSLLKWLGLSLGAGRARRPPAGSNPLPPPGLRPTPPACPPRVRQYYAVSTSPDGPWTLVLSIPSIHGHSSAWLVRWSDLQLNHASTQSPDATQLVCEMISRIRELEQRLDGGR